jgi:hypothetical protein
MTLTVMPQVFEKSRLHRGQVGAAVYVAPNCTVALAHIDVNDKDFKGTDYRGVSRLIRLVDPWFTKGQF